MTHALLRQIARFAPVTLAPDLAPLAPGDRESVARLVDAARLIDGLFLEQVWSGNAAALLHLAADTTAEGRAALRYFMMNKGPWSRLDDNEPFVGAALRVPPKPPQANFYPADATRDEVDGWIDGLRGDARAHAAGFYTLIRRDQQGQLTSVPYSVAYRNQLVDIAAHLRAAAATTGAPTLRRFLELRAEALLSNDYYASDVAWMEIDAPIEPTIGPYETYEDEWFGYKAAFEAFIGIRDDEATAKLAFFGRELQGLEDALPIDPRYRSAQLGALAPIRVVNLVFSSGDGNRGVHAAAFNLPNDDRILQTMGAKRVMLKNVQEAKFAEVLQPIARAALAPSDAARVSFDAFFTHILMHELMHGLGPHQTHPDGHAVRHALKDAYAAIEEAKADISGLWALTRLADQGRIAAPVFGSLYVTFLASAFRSLRFGLNEAHGKGIALQLNVLLDHGAVVVAPDGTFGVVEATMRRAIEALTGQIMTIQGEGNYRAAKALLERHVFLRPEVKRVLDTLVDVPVDIAPRFQVI